jgi:hypothetical protein
MAALVLYTRPGCHLCDVVKDVLAQVQREVPFTLAEVNIDEDPAAQALYRCEIPVVTIDGRKAFKYRVDPAELRRRLAYAAAGRYEQCTPPDAPDVARKPEGEG